MSHSISAAVVFLGVLFYFVLNWHAASRPVSLDTRHILEVKAQEEKSSLFVSDGPDDEDANRDKVCREFLFNFLNGTTDAKDECLGFYNAWQAADCGDDGDLTEGEAMWYSFLEFIGIVKRQHKLDNGTTVDDDVAIDDYYENWQCCSSITDFYSKHCQKSELDAFQLLCITLGLVVCGVSKSLLKVAGLEWIPDAGAFILVGSIIGGVIRVFSSQNFSDTLIFDNELFLQILLPPIIFEASLSIDKKAFRRDLFPILTLAVFGTFFSALAIGYGTYFMTSWGKSEGLPLLDSLVFGALMSSIDPVATLSILSGNGVNPRDTLYNLIFGESLLNDGVSIVLFNSLVQHIGDAADITSATITDTLRDFVWVTTSSLVIGISCGAVCNVYFYALRGKHSAVTEVAMFFTWALIPYYIADGLECSGIIAIMVMGFMLDYYVVGSESLSRRLEEAGTEDNGRWIEYMGRSQSPVAARAQPLFRFLSKAFSGRGHIHQESRYHVGFVAEVIANLMETAIFGYLGLFLFNDKSFNFKLLFSGLISCVTSRAAMVLIASLLINFCVFLNLEEFLGQLWVAFQNQRYGRNTSIMTDDMITSEKLYLDRKTQMILFSAGVRGAVSYALVQNIPVYNAVTKHGSKFKTELRAMTSASIVVLIFAFGAMTYYLIKQGSVGVARSTSSQALTDHLLLSEIAPDQGELYPDTEYQQDPGLDSLELDETVQRGQRAPEMHVSSQQTRPS